MRPERVGRALLFALALLVGCGGDDGVNPLADALADLAAPDLSVGDLSVGDLAAGPPDFAGADATCAFQRFGGFIGPSPFERRVDCSCGCLLDSFETTRLAGYWGAPSSPGAAFQPSSSGLGLAIASTGAAEFAAINSNSTLGPFYLDGDFDLFVDYRLSGALPVDAHVLLTAQLPSGVGSGRYVVGRERLLDTTDDYTAQLGGVPTVEKPTAALSGTLELKRTGNTLDAIADGSAISRFAGASTARLSLIFTGALGGCVSDGGACTFTVTFHNARMTAGALVDRQ